MPKDYQAFQDFVDGQLSDIPTDSEMEPLAQALLAGVGAALGRRLGCCLADLDQRHGWPKEVPH